MNIKRAKQEIKNAIEAYLLKDEEGNYEIPVIRQRPIFLIGAPGIGKTQIMEQIASERPDLLVGKIDVDEEPELARAFGVSSIPMLAVMRDGILVNAAVGARPKESILELVDN